MTSSLPTFSAIWLAAIALFAGASDLQVPTVDEVHRLAIQPDAVFIKALLLIMLIGLGAVWWLERRDRKERDSSLDRNLLKLTQQQSVTNAILFFHEEAQVAQLIELLNDHQQTALAQRLIDRMAEVERLLRVGAGFSGTRSS